MKEKRERTCTELNRIIKSMEDKYLQPSLDMVRSTFTDSENAKEADLVVRLIEEIRSMSTYVPELELIMVNDEDEVIGYAMFSGFHLGGKYRDELLLLSPVAVKTELQRQHISKELIEYGFEKATQMGFSAVIVEGNPQNYRKRGFQTSAAFGIVAAESVGLPAVECMMVKELQKGALEHIHGVVEYTDYKTLM